MKVINHQALGLLPIAGAIADITHNFSPAFPLFFSGQGGKHEVVCDWNRRSRKRTFANHEPIHSADTRAGSSWNFTYLFTQPTAVRGPGTASAHTFPLQTERKKEDHAIAQKRKHRLN